MLMVQSYHVLIAEQQIYLLIVRSLDLIAVPEYLAEGLVTRLLKLLWLLPRAVSVFTHELERLAGTLATAIGEHHRIKAVTQLDSHQGLYNDCKAIVLACDTYPL